MLILNNFIENWVFFGIFHNSLFFNKIFSERPYDLLINNGHGRIVLNKDNRDLKCFPDCPQSSYCDMGMCRCKHRLLVRTTLFFPVINALVNIYIYTTGYSLGNILV